MLIKKTTYEGKLDRDIHGRWEDCDRGLYIDSDHIDSIFSEFKGKRVRLTIEEIPNKED